MDNPLTVTTAQAMAPMPPSIVAALCKVQATIEAVKKSHRNQHGGYQFASTDDIYAALTIKLAEAGLMIMPLELTPVESKTSTVDQFDKAGNKVGVKTVTSLRFHFGYMLATAEASWFDPRSSRTLVIQHTGPQTFNAAESYAQKQFLRALFKLPTGDMDLDSLPQAETDNDLAALNGGAKRKSSSAAKKDGTDLLLNEIKDKIGMASSPEILQQVRTLYASEWSELPARWSDYLDGEYETRMDALRGMR